MVSSRSTTLPVANLRWTIDKPVDYGVLLDVFKQPAKLQVVTNPLAEGLFKPESALELQKAICFATPRALYPLQCRHQFSLWPQQQLNMVGHAYPGE